MSDLKPTALPPPAGVAPAARDEATDATTAPAVPQECSPAVGRGLDLERISADESVHRAMVRQELTARSLYRSPFQIDGQTVALHGELCRTRISTIAAVAAVIAAVSTSGAGERGSASANPALGFAGRGPRRHDFERQVDELIRFSTDYVIAKAGGGDGNDEWRKVEHCRRNLLAVLHGIHDLLFDEEKPSYCPDCNDEHSRTTIDKEKTLESLRKFEAYFDRRADAEYFTDSAGPHPNEEMSLLHEARVAIHSIELVAALQAPADDHRCPDHEADRQDAADARRDR